MKLKLTEENEVSTLTVLESVAPQQLAILKAGINKLFQSGKLRLIVDFSKVPPGDLNNASLLTEITGLQAWAQKFDGQLIAVTGIEGSGNAPSVAEAMKSLGSSLAKLIATEAALKARILQLEVEKKSVEQALSTAVKGADPRAVRRENSDLKAQIRRLQDQIRYFMKYRSDPYKKDPAGVKSAELQSVLVNVLKMQGVLK